MKSKKLIASTLILTIATTTIPVFADTEIPEKKTGVESRKQVLSGNLEVDIKLGLPIINTTKELTNISLSIINGEKKANIKLGGNLAEEIGKITLGDEEYEYKITKLNEERGLVTLDNPKVSYFNVQIFNLPTSKYDLKVSGDGFSDLSLKDVELKGYSKRVILDNKKNILTGDVNKDGKVNDADYNLVLDNIETNNLKYDLNRDGLVDIVDLHYIHNNEGSNEKKVDILDTEAIIDPSKIEIKYDETKQNVLGEIGNLFNDSKEGLGVGLKDENGIISKETPVELNMNFKEEPIKTEKIVIKAKVGSVAPKSGTVRVTDINGNIIDIPYGIGRSVSDGDIVINLGKEIAIKEITIVITGTTTEANLAEIAKIEFLNNVYEEIPAPDLNIPKINLIDSDSEEITVGFNKEPNVTGYEVKLKKKDGTKEEKIIETTENKVTFTKVENFTDYYASVQSVNGKWKSGFSEERVVQAKPKSKPAKPEGVKVNGEYKYLNISWSKNKRAESYDLYYRAKGEENFKSIKDIKGTSYKLTGLLDNTEYEVYLIAKNYLGESEKSQMYTGKTSSITIPDIPKYKQINTSNGFDKVTNHIKNVEYPSNQPLDEYEEEFDKFDIVDDNFKSHWTIKDWDTSVYSKRGPIVTFDKEYKMDTIMFQPRLDGTRFSLSGYSVKYFDGDGKDHLVSGSYQSRKSNGQTYYILKLDEPITSNKIQLNISGYGGHYANISEVKFYNYDSLEDDTRALFKDDLLIELNEGVTLEQVKDLQDRANTKDSVSGEYHPFKESILRELKIAEDILNDKAISKEVFTVNQNITREDNSHLGFNMANDYQSLGIVAKAYEELNIYVGTKGNVLPKLVFTQFYPESNSWVSKEYNLSKGKNTITVPELTSMDVEKGGSVYIRYPSKNKSNDDIKIRVSGGEKIPYLSLAGKLNDKSKEAEVKEDIRNYIKTLENHMNEIQSKYKKDNIFNVFAKKSEKYDEKTSILNNTEIETDKVTLSLPASKILEGINVGVSTEDEKVNRVYDSLKAWEQIMDIAYAEKGLYKNPDRNNDGAVSEKEAKHKMPKSRMNIRYTRMFDGAFMYASAGHVGIEANSTPPLMRGTAYVISEDGKVTNGNGLFGWGISHEIGHVIDQSGLTYVETTNNILALLVQTFDDKSKSRLETSNKYEEIYNKVTSGTKGLPSDVFTKLGMFWQLHLAYDNKPNYTMLNDDNDSFYAKLYREYRESGSEMNSLTTEDRLVRIASDVVKKDLSDFFYAYGIRPSKETLEYVKKYPKEERNIKFINDEARRQRLNGVLGIKEDTVVNASFEGAKEGDYINSKRVSLNLGVNKESEKILGYEILRNGDSVGFTTENSFTDIVENLNNRAVKYEVIGYDYLLNKTEKKTVGTVKVAHDGSVSKDIVTIDTNTKSDADKNDHLDTTGPVISPSKNNIIDNKLDTVYEGNKIGSEDPYVILELNTKMPIVGLKYTAVSGGLANISDYQVYVSDDKKNWTLANAGEFDITENKNTDTIYFNRENTEGGKQLWTYEASYIKLVAKGNKSISISELDIIGPPGDNIEIGNRGNKGIGKLTHDYEYAKGKVIPKDSIIITGEYRGNPAFNVPLIRNERSEILGGKTILLADIPSDGHLGEISKGTFIYWIEPKEKVDLTKSVYAELYRVNDPITNDGQRLVSDTMKVDVPEVLPDISFEGGINNADGTKEFLNK